jgi:hypothetical protein
MTIFVDYAEYLPADIANDKKCLEDEHCCVDDCEGIVVVEATGYPAFCRESLGRTYYACKEHSLEAFVGASTWASEQLEKGS